MSCRRSTNGSLPIPKGAEIHSVSKVGCVQHGFNPIYLVIDPLATDFWRSATGQGRCVIDTLPNNEPIRYTLPRSFMNSRQLSRESLQSKLVLYTPPHPSQSAQGTNKKTSSSNILRRTRHRPNSPITPRPRPVAVQRFLTVVGRV